MKPAPNTHTALDALRQARPLAEHPDVLTAAEQLTRAQANVPAAVTELERAEAQLAQAEAVAAEATTEGDEIDQRPLAAARKRLMDAESTLRIRRSALRQAQMKVEQVEDRVHADIVAAVREAYQDRLPAFDAKIAEAAALDRELAEIAEIGRRLLSGALGLDDVTYWTPLLAEDTCQYLHWRAQVEARGFVLPPASAAHTLPAKGPLLGYSSAGFSNAGQQPAETSVPIGPGGQFLPPDLRVRGSILGTAVTSWAMAIAGAVFR